MYGHVISSHFLWEIRYVVLFYIIGDCVTTVFALPYGYEGNIFLMQTMSEYGILGLFLLKILFLAVLLFNYCVLANFENKLSPVLWDGLKRSVGVFGILLVINNLSVIYFQWALF